MRHFLIPVLLLSLAAGCSSVKIGPHRIDVQQGNALDQENVARLKLGLNRSQVRFLLGTPLVVDPFRTDRWDYVYVYYKAGKLAEQKRITLFFDGDTLTRIDGDLSAAGPAPVAQAEPKAAIPVLPSTATTAPMPGAAAPQPAPIPVPASRPAAAVTPAAPAAAAPAVAAPPVAAATAAPAAVAASQPAQAATAASSVVPPLPSPKNAPAYVDPRPPAELSLQPETDVTKIQPDVVPSFPATAPLAAVSDATVLKAAVSDATVLKAVNEWAEAWARRDNAAYLAAYDAGFVPQGGASRADWEKRKRQALNAAKRIELEIDSPVVERTGDAAATVTFNQFYRSDSYRDAVVKQLRMVERDGRWLIVEEKVLSVLHGVQP